MQQPEPGEPKTNLLLEARHTLSIAAAKRKRAKVSTSLFLPRELARKTSKLMNGPQGSTKQRRAFQRRIRKRRHSNHPESFALVRPHISRERIRNAVDTLRQGIDTEIESAQVPVSPAMESNKKLNVNTVDKGELPDLSSTVPLVDHNMATNKKELLNETSQERNETENYPIDINFVLDYATVAELASNDESEARIELANYVATSEEKRSASNINTALVEKNDLTSPVVKIELDGDNEIDKALLNDANSIPIDHDLGTVVQPMVMYTKDALNSVDLPFSNRVSVIMKNQLSRAASAGSTTMLEMGLIEPPQQQLTNQMADEELFRAPLPPPPSHSTATRLPCFKTQFSRQYPHILDTTASRMTTQQYQDLERRREFYRQQFTYQSMQLPQIIGEMPYEPLANHYKQSLQPSVEQANQKLRLRKDYRKDANNRDASMALQRRHSVFVGTQPAAMYNAIDATAAAVMPGVRLPSTCSPQQQMSGRHCSEIKTYVTPYTPPITTTTRSCDYSEPIGLRYYSEPINGSKRQMTSSQSTMSTAFSNEPTSGKPLNLVTSKRRKTDKKIITSLTTTSTTWSSSAHKLMSTAFLNQQAYRTPSNLSKDCDKQANPSASAIMHLESTTSQNQYINAAADMRRAATPAVLQQSSAVIREQTTKKKRTHSESQPQHVHRAPTSTDTIQQSIAGQTRIPFPFPNHNNEIPPVVNLNSSASHMQTPNIDHQQIQTMPMTHYQSAPYSTINRSQMNHEFQPIHNYNNHGIHSFSALQEPNSCMAPQRNCCSAINHDCANLQTLEEQIQYKNRTQIQSQVASNQNTADKLPQRHRQSRKTMPVMAPAPPAELQLTNPLCAMLQLGPQRMPGPPPLVTTRNNYYPITPPLTPTYQQQFTTDYPSSMPPPAPRYTQQHNYFNLSCPVDATPNMPPHTISEPTLNTDNFYRARNDRPLGQPMDRPLMNYWNRNNSAQAQQMVPPTMWVNSQTQNINFYRST